MLGRKKEKTESTVIEKPDYRLLSDGEILEYVAHKDEDAFSFLVEKYEKFVYSAVFAELRNEEDVFDASQEVFIRLWNAAGGFRCESTLKTWLYRMCKNCAYDYMRKFYKHKDVSLTVIDTDGESTELDVAADTAESPEEIALSKERQQQVRKAIFELPNEQRDVIVLRELRDMPYSEIAEVLGISEGTVKSRINRARETLRKTLAHLLT